MSGWYLEEHPNRAALAAGYTAGWWGYRAALEPKRVGVVHEAVIRPDLDGQDSTAEAVAAYASNTADRKVSYHDVTDTDSAIHLMPATSVAFHVGNFNTPSVGVEQGFDGTFETLPDLARFAFLFTCGITLTWRLQQIGSPPRLLTQAEAFAGARGWTTHKILQPPPVRFDPEWSDATLAGFGDLLRWMHSGGRVIGLSDTGPAVVDAQRALIGLGYKPGAVDGIAGSRFDDTVRQWETDHGKPATGLWAPWTHHLDPDGREPQEVPAVNLRGNLDAIEAPGPGKLRVIGWAGHNGGETVEIIVAAGGRSWFLPTNVDREKAVRDAVPGGRDPLGFIHTVELDAVKPGVQTRVTVFARSASGEVALLRDALIDILPKASTAVDRVALERALDGIETNTAAAREALGAQ